MNQRDTPQTIKRLMLLLKNKIEVVRRMKFFEEKMSYLRLFAVFFE
jgi:hypothetical protein